MPKRPGGPVRRAEVFVTKPRSGPDSYPPSDEAVSVRCFLLAETFSGPTISALLGGLRELGADVPPMGDVPFAYELLSASRREATGGSGTIGRVAREPHEGFKGVTAQSFLVDDLPEQVQEIHLHFDRLMPGTAVLVASVVPTESAAGSLHRELSRADRDATYQVGERPLPSKSARVADVRSRLESIAARWVNAHFPGDFAAIEPGRLPALTAITTLKGEVLEGPGAPGEAQSFDYVHLLGLGRERQPWRCERLAASWRLTLPTQIVPTSHPWSLTLAAREGRPDHRYIPLPPEVLELHPALGRPYLADADPSSDDLPEGLMRSMHGFMARWAVHCALKAWGKHLDEVQELLMPGPDQPADEKSLVQAEKTLALLTLSFGTFASGLRWLTDSPERYRDDAKTFERVTPGSPAEDASPDLLAGFCEQDQRTMSMLLDQQELLREQLSVAVGLMASRVSIRLQHNAMWLTRASLAFAAVSVTVTVVGLLVG